jgi:hypothetical protein
MVTPIATKIMIIRHAEKPDDKGQPYGVDVNGVVDKESLIPRGWQRAGALVVLFDPARGPLQSAELAVPNVLFAATVTPDEKSERPMETITPLSDKLSNSICRRLRVNTHSARCRRNCSRTTCRRLSRRFHKAACTSLPWQNLKGNGGRYKQSIPE